MKNFFALSLIGLFVVSSSTLSCSSCPWSTSSHDAKVSETSTERLETEIVISGLSVPWSFEFAHDGRLFIAERPGRLRIYEHGALKKEPLFVWPDVESGGEGGLMGMTLHPDFLNNHLLYVCYTRNAGEPDVVVKRYREENQTLVNEEVLLDKIPAANVHVGCRLKFGPDRKLYVTTGDATKRTLAQDLSSLAGKTLRLNDDGSVPTDNPFYNTANARKEIWSLGHRNAQGMDFQPGSGTMFQTEHGPSGFDGPGGGDEVNIVERGQNLGWPIVHHKDVKEGFVSPILEYTPAVAPGGATFYRGPAKNFHGNFFFACLRGEALIRVVLEKNKVVSQERWFEHQFGRIRHVAEGPDGALYFSTSNRDGRGSPTDGDDRIIRVRLQ